MDNDASKAVRKTKHQENCEHNLGWPSTYHAKKLRCRKCGLEITELVRAFKAKGGTVNIRRDIGTSVQIAEALRTEKQTTTNETAQPETLAPE
jgi:hypothetical protein